MISGNKIDQGFLFCWIVTDQTHLCLRISILLCGHPCHFQTLQFRRVHYSVRLSFCLYPLSLVDDSIISHMLFFHHTFTQITTSTFKTQAHCTFSTVAKYCNVIPLHLLNSS